MPTIRKRAQYQWEAQVRRRGYPAQSKTFTTKAEAEAWANMIESEMSRGVWVSRSEAEATSLYEALKRYEEEVSLSKKGAAQESSVLKTCKEVDLARRPLATIRSADIARLRDEWLKDYKPATVLRRLAVLSHVFNVARKEWGMESLSNPVELVRKPQPNNARTRRIEVSNASVGTPSVDDLDSERRAQDGELERVAKASNSVLLPPIIWLAVETAMRRGEIVSLLWANVDLNRRVAHLPSTKNGDTRDVPLSSRAVSVLQTLGEARNNAKNKMPDGGEEETDRIFEIRSDAVTRAFERAVARARKIYVDECSAGNLKPDSKFLTDLRFHDLRHEATSRLASIFPLHELTKITGHKDPRMLMRYYHPRAEELAKRLS
ncbi:MULTISPECIES: site-specific integrase [Burkholderia]|uniref:site-specific integrase n=1 Tax=Burkholderia TaxID=32008 RepID=UPI000550CD9D|nr:MULTISPECIES: site-specific integrase [Burkholderia]TCT29155.1 site-specific recombinase XerD [Burkholderia vietnamiensis]SCZ31982.1 Site-specific recombinase XerD [Burkholderia vietnamiensis]SFX86131.1 Site-specific recombinase XerD [Burkholderia vietnamiensis]